MNNAHPLRVAAPGLATFCLLALAVAVALPALAAGSVAGKLVFAAGEVRVERDGGRALKAGDPIEVGDVVVTGAKSRAQLLMADGARVALRAGTRFRVDAFSLPAAVSRPGQAQAVATDGQSVATLLKGGFRTRTGMVGKQDPAAYEVRTPVGVLGIRGTEYVAVFCNNDCETAPGVGAGQVIRPGLYLGGIENRIVFRAPGRPELEVGPGEFVFIPLSGGVAEQLRDEPSLLKEDGAGLLDLAGGRVQRQDLKAPATDGFGNRRQPAAEPPAPAAPGQDGSGAPGSIQQPIQGTDGQGRPVDLTSGVLPPQGPERRDVALAASALGASPVFSGVAENAVADYAVDGNGDLNRFAGPYPAGAAAVPAAYDIGTATVAQSAADAGTGLRWGRWSGGQAIAQASGQPNTIDLGQASLHWIVSADAATPPTLPVAGTVSYTLVGGTSPTDPAGNVGTLGSASLTADFTNGTVASDLNLALGTVNWSATGTGVIGAQLGLPAHQFGGNYTVTITGGQAPGGTGGFSGFFVTPGGSDPAVPGGAGLSYALIDDAGLLSVQGTAAFEAP
jgi:hypothetical protein